MNNIEIEVHVPILNEIESLDRLVLSFETQLFKNFRVVFHDNASDDGTSKVIEGLDGLNSKYKHLRYRTRGNWWTQLARILAYPKSTKYVSLRSANDYIFPDYFGEIFEILQQNPDCALSYSHGYELPVKSKIALYNPLGKIDTKGMDPIESLRHTVGCFTQPFSFWGTYRWDVFDRITPVVCYGQDHVQVAEASTYGVIIPTKGACDMLINRERTLTNTERELQLNPLWTAYHPQISRGMPADSKNIDPNIFTPFTSMLLGHLRMLLTRYQDHAVSQRMIEAAILPFKHRFSHFVKLEAIVLRQRFGRYNQLITDAICERPSCAESSLVSDLYNSASYAELLLAGLTDQAFACGRQHC